MAVIAGALSLGAVASASVAVGVAAAGVSAATSVVGGAIQSGQEHKAMVNARNAKESA